MIKSLFPNTAGTSESEPMSIFEELILTCSEELSLILFLSIKISVVSTFKKEPLILILFSAKAKISCYAFIEIKLEFILMSSLLLVDCKSIIEFLLLIVIVDESSMPMF